jgi:hypothetical protein
VSKEDSDFGYGFFFGALAMAFLVLIILAVTGTHMAGTNGYCAALNGEPITYNVCNVDGKVVEVP